MSLSGLNELVRLSSQGWKEYFGSTKSNTQDTGIAMGVF